MKRSDGNVHLAVVLSPSSTLHPPSSNFQPPASQVGEQLKQIRLVEIKVPGIVEDHADLRGVHPGICCADGEELADDDLHLFLVEVEFLCAGDGEVDAVGDKTGDIELGIVHLFVEIFVRLPDLRVGIEVEHLRNDSDLGAVDLSVGHRYGKGHLELDAGDIG